MLAPACYNDRDTLGYELHNRPDIQRALTGRFDRYPPLYYKMRIARLRAEPTLNASEYDDLAVALGRLGRTDEALAALAQKARLPGLTKDDQYRLYANRGTTEVHKWFQDGAKSGQIAELKTAERDIATALALNPNAHFGREGTQLELIRWLIDVKGPDPTGKNVHSTLSMWLRDHLRKVDIGTSLSGLIMLGGAWESPDTALAIAGVLRSPSHRELMTIGLARYQELLKLGRKPMDEDLADDEEQLVRMEIGSLNDKGPSSTWGQFKQLRREADAWHAEKTQFIMVRLGAGRHPDTDPHFWDGWTETPMPLLSPDLPSNNWVRIVTLSGFSILLFGFLIGRDLLRRRARRAAMI